MNNYDFYVAGNETLINAFEKNPGWAFLTTPSALDNSGA
jgi:hypothetical protein